MPSDISYSREKEGTAGSREIRLCRALWKNKVSFLLGKLSSKTKGSFKLVAVVTLMRMALAFSNILLVLACVKGGLNITANRKILCT